MKQCMRYWPLLMALFGCHGPDSQLDSINENLRNNSNVTLIRNTIPTADRLPNLPVNPAYFVVMTEVKDGKNALLAYPVNCEDSEADTVLSAFGLSKTTATKTSFGLKDLTSRFAADQQPVLNCANVGASGDKRMISAVFRLQDSEGQPAQQNPTYYAKFRGFPDQLFQVGCLDILNKFAKGSTETVNFAETAIPLADAHILPYLAQDIPEQAFGEAVKGDVGIRRLSCRSSGLSLPAPSALSTRTGTVDEGSDSRLLHVEKPDDSYYVYAWSQGSRRVECPGATESDILQAFNFATDAAVNVDPTDPAVVAADQIEPLRCVNPLFPQSFNVGFRTVDVQPEQHAYKASRESSELFTFGCASAEAFFIGDTISREAMIPVAQASLDYLLSHPNLSKPTQNVERVHVACAGIPYKAYQKYFNDIYWASLGRVPTAAELESYIAWWKAFKLPLDETYAASVRNSLSATVKNDANLRNDFINRVIADAKAHHDRFPGMDRNAVYPYEWGYFNYWIVNEAGDSNLSMGLYRNIYGWITSTRSHLPRATIDASYQLVYGCHLGRTDCTPESDYTQIFQIMYQKGTQNLTQDDLVREHERWLDSCTTNINDSECRRSINILAETVCNKNRGNFCPDSERSWLLPKLQGEAIIGSKSWILPNKASMQCYLRMRKENPNYNCRFHTLDAAAQPFLY